MQVEKEESFSGLLIEPTCYNLIRQPQRLSDGLVSGSLGFLQNSHSSLTPPLQKPEEESGRVDVWDIWWSEEEEEEEGFQGGCLSPSVRRAIWKCSLPAHAPLVTLHIANPRVGTLLFIARLSIMLSVSMESELVLIFNVSVRVFG